MELNAWKTGVQQHIPALQVFLKNVLLRKCDVKLQGVNSYTNKEAVDKLQASAIVVRAVEEKFETEILLGFSKSWLPLLTQAILNGAKELQNNEITKDLFEEFLTHWLKVVQDSFQEVGIELKMAKVDMIKTGQLGRSLNLTRYFTASLQVEQKFEMEGDNQGEPLTLAVALAYPNKEELEVQDALFSEENPFVNGTYAEIISQKAGKVDLNRVEQERQPEEGSEEPQGNINVKGRTVEFENFDKSTAVKNDREVRNINMLKNVEMNLSVELGRRNMPLGKILQLVKGSVIELEKLAGEPVEILVNGQTIARGDVVVIDEHFGVRISNLLATQEHLKELG